jgi:hypothetical protein
MTNLVRLLGVLRRATRALIAVNVALTALLAAAWATGALALPHAAPDATSAVAALADGASTDAIDEKTVSDAVTGKAVFRTNRMIEEKTVDELAQFQFRGANLQGGDPRAYVKDLVRGKMLTVRAGEQLGGRFDVTEVSADAVHLRRGNEFFELRR